MGWWESEDGTGFIGDRPADILGSALADAFGERFDLDLFGGFLASVGAALLRNPDELVRDAIGPKTAIVAELSEMPGLVVPIRASGRRSGLDDGVYDALEAVAFQYRVSELDRLPRLAEILETIAFVARGHVTDANGRTVPLERVRPGSAAESPMGATPSRAFGWVAMRALIAGETPADENAEALVGYALGDSDWRARMSAVLAVGRLRLRSLSSQARIAPVPPLGAGVSDDDRRALLALREVASARAEGRAVERPLHSDASIAERRGDFLAAVEAAVSGTALPGPGSPAYVLHALVDPAAVLTAEDCPPGWREWL
jgi:hypothetical protein